jgi:hypothetical protein
MTNVATRTTAAMATDLDDGFRAFLAAAEGAWNRSAEAIRRMDGPSFERWVAALAGLTAQAKVESRIRLAAETKERGRGRTDA